MDPAFFVQTVRWRWRIVAACVIGWLVVAGAYLAVQSPRYQAEAQIFVATRGQPSGSDAYQGDLFTQDRIRSYVTLIDARPVMQAVIDELHLPYTWEHLAGEVTASSPPGTVLINVTVTDATASGATAIANSASAHFSQYVTQLETVDASGPPVKLSVSQPAIEPTSPVKPTPARDLAVALLVGLATGLVVAMVVEWRGRSAASAEQMPGPSGPARTSPNGAPAVREGKASVD